MKNNGSARSVSRRKFIRTAAAGLSGGALVELAPKDANADPRPYLKWNREADVVVVGAGATGLPAAIQAAEGGATVIVIDANHDVGGHAIVSGGNVALGGGTSMQKKYGIADSADQVFSDLADWSVVEPNGFPDYRYNDREIIRAFANESAATIGWLVAHGVIFVAKAPDNQGAIATGNSAPREHHAAAMDWPQVQTGRPVAPELQATTSSGIGLIRPLEMAARKAGVQILLQHRMASLVRESGAVGRVTGIRVTNQAGAINIRARKGVIIATGGHSSNVNFRRIFDPRLTEEYSVAGEPYTQQDASGEIAAISIGASLWGAYNQSGEFGIALAKAGRIGCRYGYANLVWEPGSALFAKAGARGLMLRDYQDVILVNQAGKRFYDETKGQFTGNSYNSIVGYQPASYLNSANAKYDPSNFLDAALAGTGDGTNGGGPIWAIFDSEGAARENWTLSPPHVDIANGYFFSGNGLAELAKSIVNPHQRNPVPTSTLEATVRTYNSYVDSGKDLDFGKPAPKYKIEKPPFYAAWATPVVHDSRAGLRISAKCEVVDFDGNVIPGLYCGGESAGGFSLHGLARCTVQGRIAGRSAATQPRT